MFPEDRHVCMRNFFFGGISVVQLTQEIREFFHFPCVHAFNDVPTTHTGFMHFILWFRVTLITSSRHYFFRNFYSETNTRQPFGMTDGEGRRTLTDVLDIVLQFLLLLCDEMR
jgi:hypothetical protein